ncbi:DUF2911 domain-containing protein [Psychroflexus sp. CAK57W]|uniref:DUF2911 domain-containing protein n=1 Tax=Psychroflexus curvus TaxID=2873595 RepID=UPI001CCC0E06|nr:DUF2911 domain-containing protein [Psychroflexus curvus]MBZ9627628.1 DUF2911 domain-containing protein [Psychroflexus curvus]MBZ9786115.1 DUF2911 domain-containing protein [Psychroflexus curvus]
MKTILTGLALAISVFTYAQVETPQPSPNSTFTQVVGLSEVSVAYSRPSANGRTIFGDLVPYDKKWRTGANENTIITFSDDVMLEGQSLSAGSYAIYTIPKKESWNVFFYEEIQNWGLPKLWNEDAVAAMVNVPVKELNHHVETFTIGMDNINLDKAHLKISWAKSMVEVPISFPTDVLVMENINAVMSGPTATDYFSSAVYYLNAGKDLEKAEEWIEKAMAMSENKPYWMLRQQSLIYAANAKKDKAIEAAKASLAAAKKAGNADYVKMNKDSLKEWNAM